VVFPATRAILVFLPDRKAGEVITIECRVRRGDRDTGLEVTEPRRIGYGLELGECEGCSGGGVGGEMAVVAGVVEHVARHAVAADHRGAETDAPKPGRSSFSRSSAGCSDHGHDAKGETLLPVGIGAEARPRFGADRQRLRPAGLTSCDATAPPSGSPIPRLPAFGRRVSVGFRPAAARAHRDGAGDAGGSDRSGRRSGKGLGQLSIFVPSLFRASPPFSAPLSIPFWTKK
jgi:hypothetical protein